jgi:hypothetical protein
LVLKGTALRASVLARRTAKGAEYFSCGVFYSKFSALKRFVKRPEVPAPLHFLNSRTQDATVMDAVAVAEMRLWFR